MNKRQDARIYRMNREGLPKKIIAKVEGMKSTSINIPHKPSVEEIEVAARALWNEKPVGLNTAPFDILGYDDKQRILKRAEAALIAIRELY